MPKNIALRICIEMLKNTQQSCEALLEAVADLARLRQIADCDLAALQSAIASYLNHAES